LKILKTLCLAALAALVRLKALLILPAAQVFTVALVAMEVESHLGLMEPPPLVVGVEETTKLMVAPGPLGV
jgi:hypothetical protein